MNLFCLCQVTYSSLAKASTNSGVNAMDLCLVRTMINFTIASITVKICKKHVIKDVQKEAWRRLILRCCLGLISFTTFVFALMYLSVSMTNIIINTSPFWTAILCYLVARTKVSIFEFVCIIGCFSGVVTLALTKKDIKDEDDNSMYLVGLICIIVCAWMNASIIVITRTLKEVHFSLIMFHYGWIASVILFIYLIIERLFLIEDRTQPIRQFQYNWV